MASEELDQLREALRQAQEELKLQESFLAVVAHELRNPLGPVVMSVDAMLIEVRRGLTDRDGLLHRLQQMRRYVERLHGDLDRLLDFSRVRNGRIDLQLEQIDVCEVVDRVTEDLGPLLKAANCPLNVSLDRPQLGHLDGMRLGQVVWNVVTNAAKYASGAPIDVVVTGDPQRVKLVVRDHGPGIAPDEREIIFRKFERAATAKQYTGFGIGLWLVRRIVEALGGTVSLDSEVNVGTTFTIELPRSR